MNEIPLTEARENLRGWARAHGKLTESRNALIRQAWASGLTKSEIWRLTGLARSTIDRVLDGDTQADTYGAGL